MIRLVRASEKDAENILKMQKRAFKILLDKYNDLETNPGNETLEKITGKLKQSFTYFYLIYHEKEIVGAVRVIDMKEPGKRKRIAPLFILPEYQNRGFAQEAISEIENVHGQHMWGLDTVLQESKNCYLYEKMGYRKNGNIMIVNEKMTLVFYEKD